MILYYFLDAHCESIINTNGTHDLIASKNNTKKCVNRIVIFSALIGKKLKEEQFLYQVFI